MLGRVAALAAGAALLTGPAAAQTAEGAGVVAKSGARVETRQSPPADDPDPLTPAEVRGPPPAAPAAIVPADEPVAAAAAPVAVPDPVLVEVRKRLSTPRGRETATDAADRAALAAHYVADTAQIHWSSEAGLTDRAKAAIAEIRNADNWGLKASAFDVPALPAGSTSAEARADAEIKLGLAILKYARHARGGRLDPQSVSKMYDRKPQVFEPRSLIQSATASREPDRYLRGLHPRHAGFRNLQKALVAARSGALVSAPEPQPEPETEGRRGKAKAVRAAPPTNAETIMRIVANMERWRWMPDNLGDFHVWNNVPEQTTTVFKSGKVVFTERIVVGKPDTATPNFSADMQFVIFQPEWGVPNGIKNNEIGPLLRRASAEGGGWFSDNGRTPSAVLARHGLRVSAGGQVINPDNVNWAAVDVNRFSFIQPAGPSNVLGVVKFRFPNKHDVYMHDTPQKHLFSAPVRAFSHGCMRVQNPVRFAEVLLEHDKGWTADRVRGMVPRGGEVKLSTQIPVHNVYFTVIADDTGKLRTLGDIYGTDSRVASALEGRAVAVASRGQPVAGEPAADGRVAQRAKGERPRRGTSTASAGSSNPFAGLFGN